MAYGAIREKTGGRDVGQWNPTTEQSAAFESATQGMSPAQKAQLSNLFRSVADREAGQLGSSQRMGGTGKSPVQPGDAAKAPAQKAKAPMEQGEMAAVENWLRTPEAQQFLGGGGAPVTGDPAQRGGMPRAFVPPQDTDPFMGESARDQQLQKTLDERAGLIAHIQGMMSGPQIGDYPRTGVPPAPGWGIAPRGIPGASWGIPPRDRIYDPGWGIQGGSRVNPNPIGQQGPRQVPPSYGVNLQVPQNRFGPYGGY